MTYWNYRVIEHKDVNGNVYYGIHEVYYNDKKDVDAYTVCSIVSYEDTVDELFSNIKHIIKAKDKPIIKAYKLKSMDMRTPK